jgi:hypothetical protein
MATEKRLIYANETITAFTNWLTSRYDGRMPRDIVAEIPTVDAVEVVHGRWIVENEESIRCSECCFNRATIKMPMDYCPNCGAKMDGDGNGNL